MNLSHRLRNIYQSQVKALKERLDRIDAEEEERVGEARFERDARDELDGALGSDLPPVLRSPEQIATGAPAQRRAPAPVGGDAPAGATEVAPPPASSLARHYRVLGLEDGADLSSVKAAYARQAARCAPDRFTEGSEEQEMALEIRKRVDAAYDALRDAIDPTAGRFDKLEL